MWATPDRSLEGRAPSGLHIAIIAIALGFVVYCALLLIGFVFKLLFIAAAFALGVMTWRVWKARP